MCLVEYEAKPGQTAKIAHVLQRIKSIPSSDLKDELERKRREKQRKMGDNLSADRLELLGYLLEEEVGDRE